MIKVRRYPRAWLAAPAVAIAAALALAVPAQAQQSRPSLNPASSRSATSQSRIVHDRAAYERALKSGNWVQTPEGLAYKTCVHSAPENAVVTKTEIISPSGAKQQIKPCTHPILANPATATAAAAGTEAQTTAVTSGPCTGGSAAAKAHWWAVSCYAWSNWLRYFQETYAVPANPQQAGALIHLWGGLEDVPGSSILQDVLSWGAYPGITNTNIWYVTPWYGDPAGLTHGPAIHVQPGNTIDGSLDATSCDSGGHCTWVETIVDASTGQQTSYTIGSGVAFNVILGAVMEVPSGSGCIETPANGHGVFRDLSLMDSTGSSFVISASQWGVSYPDRQCSVVLNPTSGGGADILWSP
jgi:hypothetical protein